MTAGFYWIWYSMLSARLTDAHSFTSERNQGEGEGTKMKSCCVFDHGIPSPLLFQYHARVASLDQEPFHGIAEPQRTCLHYHPPRQRRTAYARRWHGTPRSFPQSNDTSLLVLFLTTRKHQALNLVMRYAAPRRLLPREKLVPPSLLRRKETYTAAVPPRRVPNHFDLLLPGDV